MSLVAGDSFVKRLESFQRHFFREKLSIHGEMVKFLGLPGKEVHDLRRVLWCQGGRYRVIVISVGSNDLCNVHRRPMDVVRELLALAEHLLSSGTTRVVICQLLRRSSTSHFVGLSLSQYNTRIDMTNNLLRNERRSLISALSA